MATEDDGGLHGEEKHEDAINEQHRGQPLVAVRDGLRLAGARLDTRGGFNAR